MLSCYSHTLSFSMLLCTCTIVKYRSLSTRAVSMLCSDISVPLGLLPDLTLETMLALKDTSVRTQSTLHALLKMFFDLNKKYSRQSGSDKNAGGDLVECVICENLPVNPVRYCTKCLKLVCKSCVE